MSQFGQFKNEKKKKCIAPDAIPEHYKGFQEERANIETPSDIVVSMGSSIGWRLCLIK
jgi:hypothetical protein